MTTDKARKRDVRTRMRRTGERYAAAQRHVQATKLATTELGISDDAIRRRTGKGWDEWIRILDRWGAARRSHAEIARWLREDHGIDGWSSQSVTVGYERARGMRAPHQQAGGFSVGVSKTVPVDASTAADGWIDARRRNRWLERGTLRLRTSQPGRSARFDFGDDGSRVIVSIEAKGPAKSTVSLQHERLPDREAVERMRGFWKERLGRMAEALAR